MNNCVTPALHGKRIIKLLSISHLVVLELTMMSVCGVQRWMYELRRVEPLLIEMFGPKKNKAKTRACKV
jgi:hypothetical protein